MTFRFAFTAAAVLGLMASGVHAEDKIVKVDGSSTVFPITEAVAEEFQIANPGVKVTVGISGTGGGFKKFCRGEIDISDASRPIKDKERAACEENGIDFIELPVSLDAIAVVLHPENDWAQELTVAELKKMWEPEAQGKITNWNQIRDSFPDMELKLFGPGVDSGTFDYFTGAINGEEQASRGDFTASEDDNVLVQGVAGDKGALGYFGLAYYTENTSRVKAAKIKAADDAEAIEPSVENARNGIYQPLSRPIFIYVSTKALEKPEVAQFVEYYMSEEKSAPLVQEVGYVPLPTEAYDAFLKRFMDRQTGSAFADLGKNPSISDIIAAPVK